MAISVVNALGLTAKLMQKAEPSSAAVIVSVSITADPAADQAQVILTAVQSACFAGSSQFWYVVHCFSSYKLHKLPIKHTLMHQHSLWTLAAELNVTHVHNDGLNSAPQCSIASMLHCEHMESILGPLTPEINGSHIDCRPPGKVQRRRLKA